MPSAQPKQQPPLIQRGMTVPLLQTQCCKPFPNKLRAGSERHSRLCLAHVCGVLRSDVDVQRLIAAGRHHRSRWGSRLQIGSSQQQVRGPPATINQLQLMHEMQPIDCGIGCVDIADQQHARAVKITSHSAQSRGHAAAGRRTSPWRCGRSMQTLQMQVDASTPLELSLPAEDPAVPRHR